MRTSTRAGPPRRSKRFTLSNADAHTTTLIDRAFSSPTMRILGAALALLLVPLLAGCTDAPEGDDDVVTEDPMVRAGRFVPWTLSDYWVYDMDIRGYDRFAGVKLAYYSEDGSEYTVGTPDYDEALYHAVFSVNPLLGRVHQQLLSPHEEGVHTHMFPFHKDPVIEDGEQWTTQFYDHPLVMVADYDPAIPTPDGPAAGFRITGTDLGSQFRATYTFVPEVKWFTDLNVRDEEGQLFHLALTDSGTGYRGAAHFIRARDMLHETVSSEGAVLTTEKTFTIAQNDVDDDRVESLAISAAIDLASGLSATLRLTDPDGEVIWERDYDDPQSGEFNIVEVWPTGSKSSAALGSRPQWDAGRYTLQFTFSGQASAEVHIVGTQDVSGRV